MPNQMPPEDVEWFKSMGIDPSTVQVSGAGQSGEMSQLGAIGSTLKAHAGGILGGGGATLLGTALAPESGGLSLLIPILAGLAGSYGGQKAQSALLSPETNQSIEEGAQQAAQQHPWTSLATDVTAGALASGGRPGLGSLKQIATQAGINTAVDTGVNLALHGQLPTGREIIGDVAGGALFSQPSALGRWAHGTPEVTQTEHNPEPTPEQPAINAPLKMAPQMPLSGETSPSAESDNGRQEKTKDTVTVNNQSQGNTTQNPVDKKSQSVGPSGLTQEEENELLGLDPNELPPEFQKGLKDLQTKWSSNLNTSQALAKDGVYATVQPDNEVPGSGYVQIDEVKNGQNIPLPYDKAVESGLSLPSKEELMKLPAGKNLIGTRESLTPKENAIQEQRPTEVLPREQTTTGETGSERRGMGQSNEGKETPGENKTGTEQTPPISGEGLPPVNKEAGPKEQPASDAEPQYHPYKAGTWAVADKVHDLPHPGGAPLADAAKQSLNETDRLRGQWKNPVVEGGQKLSNRDKAGLQKVMDTELSKQAEQPQMVAGLSKKAQAFYATAKKLLSDNADYRIKSGEPVYQGNLPRMLKKVPWYWPGMPNQQIEQVYRNNTDQAAIAKLDKTFDTWNQQKLGMTPQASAKMIQDFKIAVQGNRNSSEISHQDYFNASRRAMGNPLPPEFREPDIVKNLSRYFDRQAIDNAHYRFMEKNPKAMAALGETKDAWGKPINFSYKEGSLANNPQVRALTRQFRPDIESESERGEGSLSGLITSALIAGPQLEAHKLISNQVKAVSMADNPYQLSRALAYGLSHIKEGWQHAKEGGVVKLTATSAMDMFNGTMTAAQRMNGLAKGIRDISTLGGLTTKLNAGLLQSYFEYMVPSKLIRANNGDVTAQRFIRRLDPTYQPGKIYTTPESQQLASVAAQYVHGTGDIRTMPSWMMNDSELSGFLSLAHWSVAQTSNFQHDVWEPAQRGNYTPLLTGVFGATVGGYIIKQLREEITGKKGGIPSLSEIASSDRGIQGNLGPLAYNAIAAMQYSGFGGLLSQVAKYPFDFVYKNMPQGATFPLDQIATDMAGTVKNVASAIANDPNLNWVDLAKAVTGHILSTDMQLSRIALNQGVNAGLVQGTVAEKKLLADKMGALRRFDMVEGLPYNDIDASNNPFMNIEQQKYKHDQDVGDAASMLPEMINNIIQRYGQNPDVMMQKIKSLKENSEQFFPSLESTPLQFMRYLNYLGRLEGPEKAQAILQDYMTRKVKNQVKSEIVP